MFLYCSHNIVYRFMKKLIKHIQFDMMLSWIIFVVLSFSIMFAAFWLLNKYEHKLLKVLVGGR